MALNILTLDIIPEIIATRVDSFRDQVLTSMLAKRAKQFGVLLCEPCWQRIAVCGAETDQSRQLTFEDPQS